MGWLVGWFWINNPLRQCFSLYRAFSQREGERGVKEQMRVKMSKQPPPAPTASAVGPCPTVIQIVGRPGTGSLPSTIAPPDHRLQEMGASAKGYGSKMPKLGKTNAKLGQKPCKYCGKSLAKNQCPAFGKICSYCKTSNHFEKVGKSKAKQKVHMLQNASHDHYEPEDTSSNDDYFEIHNVELSMNAVESSHEKQVLATMIINYRLVQLQIDTGASCNDISSKYLNQHQLSNLTHTSQVLIMYNKKAVIPKGKLKLKRRNPKTNRKYKAEFVLLTMMTVIQFLVLVQHNTWLVGWLFWV